MIRTSCTREQDVLDAIAANRWPDRMSDELSAHIAGCGICGDLASLAHAFAEDHETAFEQARVPSAGLVWWRAEIRTRQQALRAAARPITAVQVITGTCGIAVALGLLAWTGLGALFGMSTRELWAVLANQPLLLPLFYLSIGVLVVGSVVLYLVLSDK